VTSAKQSDDREGAGDSVTSKAVINCELIRVAIVKGSDESPVAGECKPGPLCSSLVTRHWSLAAGVTLLELLVVGTLAAILLALVFPSIHAGMKSLSLHSSAQRLAAAAKYARDQAIYRQRPYELEIDSEAGTVSVIDSSGEARSFELPVEVRIESISPKASETPLRVRRFLFSPDGSSVPFEVILENSRRRVQVTTDPLTGFPKIADL
jgi:general secretion pathway protein H